MKKQFDKNKTKDRPKMIATFYEKAFGSFMEMVTEFRTLHPEFSIIFNNADSEMYPEWAASDAVNYFANNIPVIAEKKNLPMSITITSNKVALKTNKFFSVEWTFKYDKEGNISNLVATVGTFTRDKNPEELTAMINNLNNNSWTVKVNDKVRA